MSYPHIMYSNIRSKIYVYTNIWDIVVWEYVVPLNLGSVLTRGTTPSVSVGIDFLPEFRKRVKSKEKVKQMTEDVESRGMTVLFTQGAWTPFVKSFDNTEYKEVPSDRFPRVPSVSRGSMSKYKRNSLRRHTNDP